MLIEELSIIKMGLKNNMKYYYTFEVNNNSFIVILNELKSIIYINMNDDESLYKDLIEVELDSNVYNQFLQYFDGNLKEFNIDYQLTGTPFQLRVWEQLKKVPYGTTISYSQLAENVGSIKQTRAVATAVGNNPIVIIIPCHRIVRKDGTIGEYSAGGPKVKKQLLNIEKKES